MVTGGKIFLREIGIGQHDAVFFLNQEEELHDGHRIEARVVEIARGGKFRGRFQEAFANQGDELFF